MADQIQLFGVGLDTRQVVAGSAQARTSLAGLTASAGKARLAMLGTAGAVVALGGAVRKLVRVGAEFEQLNAQLVTVTGSQRAATAAFRDLERFAALTPFALQENVQAFIRLKALGIDPTIKVMTDFGNIAAAFGRDIVDIARAVQGAVTGETEALKAFGIVSRIHGERITFAFQGVERTVNRTTNEIVDALQTISSSNFAGAMERQMDTLNGQVSNLGDNFATLARTLSKPFVFTLKFGGALLNQSLEGVNNFIARAAQIMAFFRNPLPALTSGAGLVAGQDTVPLGGGGGGVQAPILTGAGRGIRGQGFTPAGLGFGQTGVRLPGPAMATNLERVGDAFGVIDTEVDLLDNNLRGLVQSMEEGSTKAIQLGGVIVSSIAAAIQSIISGGGLGGFIGSLSAGIGGIVGLGNPLLGLGIAAGGGLLASAIAGGRDDPVRVNLVDISDRALDKQNVRDPVTNIFFAGQQVSSGNVADTLAQIREYERRTGVKVTSG